MDTFGNATYTGHDNRHLTTGQRVAWVQHLGSPAVVTIETADGVVCTVPDHHVSLDEGSDS